MARGLLDSLIVRGWEGGVFVRVGWMMFSSSHTHIHVPESTRPAHIPCPASACLTRINAIPTTTTSALSYPTHRYVPESTRHDPPSALAAAQAVAALAEGHAGNRDVLQVRLFVCSHEAIDHRYIRGLIVCYVCHVYGWGWMHVCMCWGWRWGRCRRLFSSLLRACMCMAWWFLCCVGRERHVLS